MFITYFCPVKNVSELSRQEQSHSLLFPPCPFIHSLPICCLLISTDLQALHINWKWKHNTSRNFLVCMESLWVRTVGLSHHPNGCRSAADVTGLESEIQLYTTWPEKSNGRFSGSCKKKIISLPPLWPQQLLIRFAQMIRTTCTVHTFWKARRLHPGFETRAKLRFLEVSRVIDFRQADGVDSTPAHHNRLPNPNRVNQEDLFYPTRNQDRKGTTIISEHLKKHYLFSHSGSGSTVHVFMCAEMNAWVSLYVYI